MANQYFKFKQFTVHQDRCAMKVCTDACIQGAFTARHLSERPVAQILDIGAGTGLLSLMLAQETAARITGIELDEAAAQQAGENFAASPWADRLQITQGDIRSLPSQQAYDFIISNPPFYEADLRSGDALRNQAMHATELDYTALLAAIGARLTPEGSCSILLPYQQFRTFCMQAAEAGLYPGRILDIRQSARHGYFRSVGIFSRRQLEPEMEAMAIHDNGNVYTEYFTNLLKAYYLYL
jgi:tRNA1Val (adenine37-N6)-methyltransferase